MILYVSGADFCYRCCVKYKDNEASEAFPHGQAGCACELFEVPEEAAPLIPIARARLMRNNDRPRNGGGNALFGIQGY